jgi:hypothetical protein
LASLSSNDVLYFPDRDADSCTSNANVILDDVALNVMPTREISALSTLSSPFIIKQLPSNPPLFGILAAIAHFPNHLIRFWCIAADDLEKQVPINLQPRESRFEEAICTLFDTAILNIALDFDLVENIHRILIFNELLG